MGGNRKFDTTLLHNNMARHKTYPKRHKLPPESDRPDGKKQSDESQSFAKKTGKIRRDRRGENWASKVPMTEPDIDQEPTSGGVDLSQEDIDDWLNIFKPLGGNPNAGSTTKPKHRNTKKGKGAWKRLPMVDREDEGMVAAFDQPDWSRYTEDACQGWEESIVIRTKHANSGSRAKQTRRRKETPSKEACANRNVFSFLNLPRELRDMIYEAAIDLSGITENVKNELDAFHDELQHINSKTESHKLQLLMGRLGQQFGDLKAPTVLLINRQIHDEAQRVLRKRSIIFKGPAANTPNIFPLSRMVSKGLMRNVKNISFEVSMKQHTDETMLGELQMGTNWFSYDHQVNESLEHSELWGYFMFDCLAMLWTPGHHVQNITISILGKNDRRDHNIEATPTKLDNLEKTIRCCHKTRNLDYFLSHLEYAETRNDLLE